MRVSYVYSTSATSPNVRQGKSPYERLIIMTDPIKVQPPHQSRASSSRIARLTLKSIRPTVQSSETGTEIIASSIPGSFSTYAEGPSSQIERAHCILQGTRTMASKSDLASQDASEAPSERGGSYAAQAEERREESPATGTRDPLQRTQSSETIIRNTSAKSKGKGPKVPQKYGPEWTEKALPGHLVHSKRVRQKEDSESTPDPMTEGDIVETHDNSSAGLEKSNVGFPDSVHAPDASENSSVDDSIRGVLEPREPKPRLGSLEYSRSMGPPKIIIQQATEMTDTVSPYRTPRNTSKSVASAGSADDHGSETRGSSPWNQLEQETNRSNDYFPIVSDRKPKESVKTVDELSSFLPFPEYQPDIQRQSNAASHSSAGFHEISQEKRRTHILRKGRYLVLRRRVLEAMLGRELANIARPSLALLAHKTTEQEPSPRAQSPSSRQPGNIKISISRG